MNVGVVRIAVMRGDKTMIIKNTEKNNMIQNVVATLAIEDMYLSKEFIAKLVEVAEGKKSSEELRQEVIKKYDTLKQEVGEVMCGALIETESRKIHNEGRAEERERALKTYAELIEKGYVTMEELEDVDINIEQLEEYMEKNGMEIPQPGKSR